jgi:hypothetical protein
MDETLIHSEEWKEGKKYDHEIVIKVDDDTDDVSIA